MASDILDVKELARGATVAKLRGDLARCVSRAEALGLTAIAIYLQRALDEISTVKDRRE